MAARGENIFFKKKKYVPFSQTMRLLEREGFIVTTEEGLNEIRVIVLGHNIDVDDEDERHFFCAFQDKHL